MTRYTTLMQIPFPDEYDDPYITDADARETAVDLGIAVSYEDAQLFVQTDAAFDLTGNVLTWDQPIYIRSPRGGGRLRIPAGNLTINNDPAYLYVDASSRFISSNSDVTMGETTSSFGISNKNRIIIGYRDGSQAFMRLGFMDTSVPFDHNGLSGIQGGTTGQYFHLTSAQHTDLTDGGDCSSHKHDDRYYQETEFINTSAGAGDSGKPIVLDGEGKIDASMLKESDIDHNDTSNIQGGSGAERYHLTSAQHTDLTDGGNCSIHRHDDRYFTEAEIGSTTGGSEGASLVGTDTKTNLNNATDVETALTDLNTKNPPAVKTHAGNPNTGSFTGNKCDFCVDTDNDDIYINVDGSATWICLT